MKIIVWTGKGGSGKSFLTAQLIYHGFEAIDLDPFGDIFDRFEEQSIYLEEHEEIPDLSSIESDVVLDFKGGKDRRLKPALERADLLIIPVVPSRESVATTLKSIEYIDSDIKKLFVINMIDKNSNLEDTIDVLKDSLEEEVNYCTIKLSKAYRTSINNNESIVAMGEEKSLRAGAYRSHAKEIRNFLNKVEEYRNEY